MPDEKTDMNALIRRAAFGMTEEEMDAEMKRRKEKQQPNDSNWLHKLYLSRKGITVPFAEEQPAEEQPS